jgi:hypothetical protein
VNEAYNLFNAVADQLYGPEEMQCSEKAPGDGGDGGGGALPEEDNGEEEEDIDAAFEKVRWPITVFRGVVNPDSLNPDPAFQANLDSDTIRIQSIENQKLKIKNTYSRNFFLYQKLQFTYPLASIKEVQATGEAFSPQKRTYSTPKTEIYQLLSIFVGHICPPGSGYGSRGPIESRSITLVFLVTSSLNVKDDQDYRIFSHEFLRLNFSCKRFYDRVLQPVKREISKQKKQINLA